MLESLLVVLSRPQPGQDAAYNDWYSHIHLHDALRFRGSVAAQRFKLSAHRRAKYHDPLHCGYLALYEVTDAARFTQEHMEAMDTDRMLISRAFDHTLSNDFYYFFCHAVDNAPGVPPAGDVVMQQLCVPPEKATEFRRAYANDILFPATARPGVRSGALLAYRRQGQIFAAEPEATFIAVYRLSDAAALDDWPATFARSPLIDGKVQTSWWTPITPRLTKDGVLHPTPELAAVERKARTGMGDNYIRFASTPDIPALATPPESVAG